MSGKKIKLVLLLLCVFSLSCAGNKNGDNLHITGIKERTDLFVTNIDRTADSEYKRIKKDFNLSSQGGELVFCLDEKNNCKKIEAVFYGETSKMTESFYMRDENNYVYVCDSVFYYSESIYEPGNVADSIEVNKFYINDNKLILWLQNNNPKSQEYYEEKSSEINSDFNLLILEKKK